MIVCCRLDQILGRVGSKKSDVYESKISLASRIVKVERQVRTDYKTELDGVSVDSQRDNLIRLFDVLVVY